MTQPIHPVLERVATSICHELMNEGQYVPDWLRLRLARAAIQALMEPDEGMCAAGREVPWDEEVVGGVVYSTASEAKAIYQAMLRPLIGEGE